MSKIKEIFGNNLRNLRKEKDWTQSYVADCLEVTTSFIAQIEAGNKGVSLDLIEAISNLFNVSAASLFLDHNEIKNENSVVYFRNAELDNLSKKLNSKITQIIIDSINTLKTK